MSRFKFFEDDRNSVLKTAVPQPEVDINAVSEEYIEPERFRYRTEQIVITKFNGEIINHGTTKQEFLITKNYKKSLVNSVNVELVENVIKFEPPQLQTAISLLCDFDIIKCDVELSVDPETGRFKEILSKSNLLDKWESYKKETLDVYNFVRSSESQQNIQNFINAAQNQIMNDELLLADYESKLFFDLIFDKYLVENEIDYAYDKYFISNLFDYRKLLLHMGQLITVDSPDLVTITRTGVLDHKSLDRDMLVKQYDEKFKPYVDFKFSTYDYRFSQSYTIDTKQNVITSADISITEEVKNNVQINITYEIKLVEL